MCLSSSTPPSSSSVESCCGVLSNLWRSLGSVHYTWCISMLLISFHRYSQLKIATTNEKLSARRCCLLLGAWLGPSLVFWPVQFFGETNPMEQIGINFILIIDLGQFIFFLVSSWSSTASSVSPCAEKSSKLVHASKPPYRLHFYGKTRKGTQFLMSEMRRHSIAIRHCSLNRRRHLQSGLLKLVRKF